MFYTVSQASQQHGMINLTDPTLDRWDRLIIGNDSKTIWKAISWRGDINHNTNDTPCDEDFKEHYENLLLVSETMDIRTFDTSSCPSIPVLDDPISPREVDEAINNIKPNKSCGPDGVSPGIFRLLPAAWILYITTIFNIVFIRGLKPVAWQAIRLVSIFKSGIRQSCNNYRGIAVSSYLFKLFDTIIYKRLCMWYKQCREQAVRRIEVVLNKF
jgi:hypothetical protein